jgi:hypothetical protein
MTASRGSRSLCSRPHSLFGAFEKVWPSRFDGGGRYLSPNSRARHQTTSLLPFPPSIEQLHFAAGEQQQVRPIRHSLPALRPSPALALPASPSREPACSAARDFRPRTSFFFETHLTSQANTFSYRSFAPIPFSRRLAAALFSCKPWPTFNTSS